MSNAGLHMNVTLHNDPELKIGDTLTLVRGDGWKQELVVSTATGFASLRTRHYRLELAEDLLINP